MAPMMVTTLQESVAFITPERPDGIDIPQSNRPQHTLMRPALINRIPVTFLMFTPLILLVCLLLQGEGASAQEAPSLTAPKFSRNVSFRSNLCDRMHRLYNHDGDNKLDLPNALQGLNLSVVLTNYKHHDTGSNNLLFSLTSEGVIDEENPGLYAIVLDALAKRAGFSWRNSYGVVDPIDATTDGNRTWTDLLEWETQVYDISAERWSRTLERLEKGMAFPESWYDARTIIVQSNSQTSTHLEVWSFLLPFEWQVWVLIVTTVVLTSLIYVWLDHISSTSGQSVDQKGVENAGEAIYHGFITATGNFEYQPQSLATRVLSFSLTFFSLLVGVAYTANLVSFMVTRNTPKNPIASLHDAVQRGEAICIPGKTSIDAFVSSKYPSARLNRKATDEEVFLALQEKGNEECKVAAVCRASYDLYRQNRAVNKNCSLYWNGHVEDNSPTGGFVTAAPSGNFCSSLLFDVLDYHLVAMKADGTLDRLWNGYLEKSGDHECTNLHDFTKFDDNYYATSHEYVRGKRKPKSTKDEKSLTVKELAGIFIVHCALSTTAVILALVTYFNKKHFSGERRLEDNDEDATKSSSDDSTKLRMEGPYTDEGIHDIGNFNMQNDI